MESCARCNERDSVVLLTRRPEVSPYEHATAPIRFHPLGPGRAGHQTWIVGSVGDTQPTVGNCCNAVETHLTNLEGWMQAG